MCKQLRVVRLFGIDPKTKEKELITSLLKREVSYFPYNQDR